MNKIVNQNYHFSDYDVQNIISERRNILIDTYKNFAENLLGKLAQEKSVEEINSYISDYVIKLNTKLYSKNEYEVLLLKINEISYWIFGNSFPLDYYNEKNNV
ncbi:hypothetical protein [Flavobacterium reichenbachii]|uniref:hypothetical protein n=1 Tax=Flavobacterium reichenbachii TaxID=362418 RepID=UPI000F4D89F0|nr:hypothetical protein [Flavobacterium reichenbachii]